MSKFIGKVLQHPQASYDLMCAVLEERKSLGKKVIQVQYGDIIKRYRSVSNIPHVSI